MTKRIQPWQYRALHYALTQEEEPPLPEGAILNRQTGEIDPPVGGRPDQKEWNPDLAKIAGYGGFLPGVGAKNVFAKGSYESQEEAFKLGCSVKCEQTSQMWPDYSIGTTLSRPIHRDHSMGTNPGYSRTALGTVWST